MSADRLFTPVIEGNRQECRGLEHVLSLGRFQLRGKLRRSDSVRFGSGVGTGRGVVACYFALTFRRSAQYFFIRAETAFRAAADMLRVRFRAAELTARRPVFVASSGKVRSSATTSARSLSSAAAAPARASSRMRSALRPPLVVAGIVTPRLKYGSKIVHS